MIETIIIFDYVGGGIDVNIVIITLFESFSLSAENVSRSFSHAGYDGNSNSDDDLQY